jgi:KUP system potassium uptake protein
MTDWSPVNIDATAKDAGAKEPGAAPAQSGHGQGHAHEHGHEPPAKSGHAQSFLALTALGVVFGDIGTSPLYTFSTALTASGHAPGATEVLGVVSLTFWALMAIISVKYVVFVLRADNDGEGGILALLSLVQHRGEPNERPKLPIAVILGIIGAALLYGDGVITPAISVLSAIEGLKFSPSAANFVVPATLVILIGLFALQYRGTGSVGRLFGPVMVVWFVVIGVLGAINIYGAPAILAAFNPLEAVRFAVASPLRLFVVLGGVFLALTGGEALYADMGHVGRPAIRLAWFGLVFPALILNYFGQGARVLVDPKAIENPFYSLAPTWAVIPLVGLATLATIIASQALISGVFSMTRQAIQMGLSPRSKIVPTSKDEAGQVYLPTANWLLMAGTLLVVVMFKSSDALASAYGIAVSGTMLMTTILLYRVAVTRWRWSPILAAAVLGAFASLEAVFLASNSLKIVEGGWFPLAVGAAIATLMLCWRKGSLEVRRRLYDMSVLPFERFLTYVDDLVIGRAPGLGVWLTKVEHGASPMLIRHLQHNRVFHERVALMSFVPDPRPRVPFAERHTLERIGHGFYRVQVRLGFMQTPDIPRTLQNIQMLGFDCDLERKHFYLAHETVVRRERNSAMGPVSFAIFSFLSRVSSRAPDYFKIPHDGVIEVGFRVEI